MFSVYNSEVVGFIPSIESESGAVEHGTQSENITTADRALQSVELHSIAVQTSEVECEVLCSEDDISSSAVVSFLRRVTPIVMEALDEDLKIDLKTPHDMNQELDECTLLQSLDCAEAAGDVFVPDNGLESGEGSVSGTHLSVLSLSWSSNGDTLAVGFGGHYEAWCLHPGLIQFYKPDRCDSDKWKLWHSLSTEGCVPKLLFHPTVPFLLAYSTYSGKIYILNVGDISGWARRCEKGATPVNTVMSHRTILGPDRIANLKWLTYQQTKIYVGTGVGDLKMRGNHQVLMAVGYRGDINIWNTELDNIEILFQYKMDDISNSLGITCFDIDSCQAPLSSRNIIVMGCMSGDIMVLQRDMDKLANDFQIYDDFGPMEKHPCCVVAVKLAHNYVASVGADGEIRIYNFANKNSDAYRMPVGIVVPHISLWLSTDTIFAATAEWSDHAADPKHENIMMGLEAVKVLTIPLKRFYRHNPTEEDREALSSCLAFNKNRNIMAVGENLSGLHIFSIRKKI